MSALWSEARLTVVPAMSTGSRLATGVTVPVRPTWYDTDRKMVEALSALNLYAIAQRGDLAVYQSFSCSFSESTFITTPSVATGN